MASAGVALKWIKEGRIRNVRVVFGGRREMIKAGFEFTEYTEVEKARYGLE